MKRLAALALAILLLALAVYVVASELTGTDDDDAAHDPVAASEISRPADAAPSRVAYVHDGDTLFLDPDGGGSSELKVRLIGIDTPELRPEVECYGLEARDRLRALLPEGAAVWVAEDAGPLDQYGRSLLYLWTGDGDFVNLLLVREGYASAVDIAPNDAYWPELRAAERAAQDAGAGMWGECR
jgi:endonuclease YncB( thermonuclease family)